MDQKKEEEGKMEGKRQYVVSRERRGSAPKGGELS
jgi:hypothetical protein